ncbi:MAG: hypothetical protein WAM85_03620 [Terracidiphilus sp.]
MKTHLKGVAWLLPFMLTACIHKSQPIASQPLAPPIVDTPPPNPAPPPADLPPPVVTVPNQTSPPATTAQTNPPAQTPKPKAHHKKPATAPAANKDTEQASSGAPEVSAIGQLSPGDPTDLQQQTEASITSTEHGLNGINRKLSDQEEKTAAQIKEFLKQAKAALATGDVDGAHTLALKAKVLLGEISQ